MQIQFNALSTDFNWIHETLKILTVKRKGAKPNVGSNSKHIAW